MADTEDRIYTPEVIPDQPFPGDGEEIAVTVPSGGTDVHTPSTTPATKFPRKIIAHETIGAALNTKSRKILAEFEFTPSGALQIGKYENGVSGDLRITPGGITARNISGITTFAIDADTGDATFLGTIQAGSVIADSILTDFLQVGEAGADVNSGSTSIALGKISTGTLTLGGSANGNGILSVKDSSGVEKILLDNTGITISSGKMTIKDDTDTTIIDATGLVSTTNFTSGSVTDSNAFTTTSDSFVDVTNMTLTFTLARESRVLFGASVVGRNDDATSTDTRSAITRIYCDTEIAGFMVTPTIVSTGGLGNTSASTSGIVTLADGTYIVKLQCMRGNGGTARLTASNPKTLWYVVLGK